MVVASSDFVTAPVPPASPFDASTRHRSRLPSGRLMATLEVAERRRASRKARRKPADRDAEVARRMRHRFHAGDVDLILLDFRYWQLRRCGWDVRSRDLRTIGHDRRTGQPVLAEPDQTPHWLWWRSLHHKSRTKVMELSGIRLVRP